MIGWVMVGAVGECDNAWRRVFVSLSRVAFNLSVVELFITLVWILCATAAPLKPLVRKKVCDTYPLGKIWGVILEIYKLHNGAHFKLGENFHSFLRVITAVINSPLFCMLYLSVALL